MNHQEKTRRIDELIKSHHPKEQSLRDSDQIRRELLQLIDSFGDPNHDKHSMQRLRQESKIPDSLDRAIVFQDFFNALSFQCTDLSEAQILRSKKDQETYHEDNDPKILKAVRRFFPDQMSDKDILRLTRTALESFFNELREY